MKSTIQITYLQIKSSPVRIINSPSVVGFLCFVAPHWFTFLYEGPDPLLTVSQSQVVHHHLGGGGVRCVSTLSHLSLEETKQKRTQTMWRECLGIKGKVCLHDKNSDLWNVAFPRATTGRLASHTRRAMANVSSSSRSSGTTLLIRPCSKASWAEMGDPVNSISMATWLQRGSILYIN